MPGTLLAKPQYARLTHDTETFARMDPFCTIKIGSQSQSTAVCENGGKNPNWGSSSLSFPITSEDVVNIEIWDKDLTSNNDLIGQGSLSLSSITSAGLNPSLTCSLSYKGKPAGDVYIQFEWYADAAPKKEQPTQADFSNTLHNSHLPTEHQAINNQATHSQDIHSHSQDINSQDINSQHQAINNQHQAINNLHQVINNQ